MATDSSETPAPTTPSTVTKQYKPHGEWTLHRREAATEFFCGKCRKQKKAKLMATRNGNWDDLCCNGCYGEILAQE